jgi:succinyl-CoA synthetase beta subunit
LPIVLRGIEAAKKLNAETGTSWYVIKAQIHAGGRGKGKVQETGSNGVVLAKSLKMFLRKQKISLEAPW